MNDRQQNVLKRVCIIGTGNVASHLCVALSDSIEELINVSSRTPEDFPLDSDCYILAVSDDAISSVASTLPNTDALVLHTAGSVPTDVLKPYTKNYGVLYPMQTFTKGIDVDYDKISLFIDASSNDNIQKIKGLAELISPNVDVVNSSVRRQIHIASVFACNYVNHLWSLSSEILNAQGLDFDILLPLIDVTVSKMKKIKARNAQTGPAVRHDMNVIETHLGALENLSMQKIYAAIAESIMQMYPKL